VEDNRGRHGGGTPMSRRAPEPNFGRLITEEDLANIEISAHALRRFVQRLEPGIPGAQQVAAAMEKLEALKGNRTGPQQGQLNRYRDWMVKRVEPHVLDAMLCEGFWASERPRWSRSQTPSDGYLQIGGMCGFPVALDGSRAVLTTCTNGRGTTWDLALERGYTEMPMPFTRTEPVLLKPAGWAAFLGPAWRSRGEHGGLLVAFRHVRAEAIEEVRLENAERLEAFRAAAAEWPVQRERARRGFRGRHSGG
jgi:hypothetical protein